MGAHHALGEGGLEGEKGWWYLHPQLWIVCNQNLKKNAGKREREKTKMEAKKLEQGKEGNVRSIPSSQEHLCQLKGFVGMLVLPLYILVHCFVSLLHFAPINSKSAKQMEEAPPESPFQESHGMCSSKESFANPFIGR